MSPAFDAVCAIIRDDPQLWSWLVAGWLGYLLVLGVWIILQKREPAATLAWLISLAALPYVGFFIYYVFGPQRIRRQRLRRGRALERVFSLSQPAEGTEVWNELSRLAHASTRLPPVTASSVQLLVDGGATYETLLRAIREARESIHLEYYIFDPDTIGTAVRDALVERARAGVAVRLLLDSVGSSKVGRRFLAPLVEAGGEVGWFHPTLRLSWRRPWLNMRLHRKIAVIDDRIGFTGGINVSDEQDERIRPDAFRDLHMRLEGEIVALLQVVFAEDWVYATGKAPPLSRVRTEPGPVAAQVLVSGPDSTWETIHRTHVAAMYAARRRVWLATPYFVPGEAAMMALTTAAMSGLDVRLLVPKRSDSLPVTLAARSYFDQLVDAGVRVYEYGPRMLHTKALLCDDDTVIVGSANFDHRSFRLNFELSVLLRDVRVASEVEAVLEQDLASAPRVRHDPDRPWWGSRLPEAAARLLSPLL